MPNYTQFATTFSSIGFLVTTVILYLNMMGLRTLEQYYVIRIALLFLSLWLIVKHKEILQQLKMRYLLRNLIVSIVLLAVAYVMGFISFNFGNPLQFKNTTNPKRISSFVVLSDENRTLTAEIKPQLNHFGALDLYFRPLVEPLITEEEEPLTTEIVFEDYLVEVYRDDNLVHSHTYPVPTLSEPHVYPIGFPVDPESVTHQYKIVLSRVSELQPRQEIAARNSSLLATPQYVIKKTEALKHSSDLIDFFELKSKIVLREEIPYLLLVLLLSTIFLFTNVVEQKRKIAQYLLLILGLYYSVYLLGIADITLPVMLPGFLGLSLVLSIVATFKTHKNQEKSKSISVVKLSLQDIAVILIACFLFFGFSTNHLGQFMSVDEPKWLHTRVPQLYDSIKNLDFAGTYINDKPGIVPAALAGIVDFFISKSDFSAANIETYLFFWRLPIVAFNTLLLPLMYWLILQILSRKTAQLAIILIATFPQLIGMSQIVNPDATVWSAGFVSALFFLRFLKNGNAENSNWAGFFLGLALLSKFIAVILYFGYFFTILYNYLVYEKNKQVFINQTWHFIKLAGISTLVYALFFPATWLNPALALKGTIFTGMIQRSLILFLPLLAIIFTDIFLLKEKLAGLIRTLKLPEIAIKVLVLILFLLSFFIITNGLIGYPPINWESMQAPRWQSFGVSSVLISIRALVLSLPEFLIITLGGFLIVYRHGNNLKKSERMALLLTLFTLSFLIFGASFVGIAAGLRYQVILLPLIALSAAIFLAKIRWHWSIIFAAVFIISILSLWRYQPFYLQQTSLLNARNTHANGLWGFGGYELAQLLNQQPGAENLVMWSDREGVNNFFVGKSYWRGRSDPFNEPEHIDYLMLTRGGENIFKRALLGSPHSFYYQVAQKLIVEHDYYSKEPEFEFCVHGIDCYRAVRFEHN